MDRGQPCSQLRLHLGHRCCYRQRWPVPELPAMHLAAETRGARAFVEDIAQYHRLSPNINTRSYKLSHRRIEDYLERKEQQKNTRDLSAQLHASVSGGPIAAPATGDVRPPAAAPAADALPATVQTKYCYHHNHAEGGCTRGDNCNFSHGWIKQTEKR